MEYISYPSIVYGKVEYKSESSYLIDGSNETNDYSFEWNVSIQQNGTCGHTYIRIIKWFQSLYEDSLSQCLNLVDDIRRSNANIFPSYEKWILLSIIWIHQYHDMKLFDLSIAMSSIHS